MTAEDLERAQRVLDFAPRAANDPDDKLHERRIQFASAEAFKASGVAVEEVKAGKIAETVPVYGELSYDPTRVTHLSSRAAGSVARVAKHLGDPVAAGDLLALIDAAEVGKAKAEFLQAVVLLDTKRKLRDRLNSSVPEPTILGAEAAVREARILAVSARQALINLGLPAAPADFKTLDETRLAEVGEKGLEDELHFLGLPDAVAKGLDRRTASNNLLPLRSPAAGIVTSRDVVVGEVVDPAKVVFEVVDPAKVWLTLGVKSETVAKIVRGKTRVAFRPDGERHGTWPARSCGSAPTPTTSCAP